MNSASVIEASVTCSPSNVESREEGDIEVKVEQLEIWREKEKRGGSIKRGSGYDIHAWICHNGIPYFVQLEVKWRPRRIKQNIFVNFGNC